jgi:arginine deiminase|tara:strand:- start:100 stop:1365 length:1266 start_codon:yes stop_codon:yes gene_type:complete
MESGNININSEIGKLEGVIVHLPGPEVENMTPENAERALYSDILNLSIALPEYNNFIGVLKKFTSVFEVSDLLQDIINDTKIKKKLLKQICRHEHDEEEDVCNFIEKISNEELATQLIQGIEMHKNNLTRFLDNEKYCLHPLPNFFFTRDASFSVGNEVIISKMARNVRDRETLIMEAIFKHHPLFNVNTVNPVQKFDKTGKGTIEGGDVIVARNDILLIGTGERTSTQGIDSVIEHMKTKSGTHHIIVQELPYKPESFIHLDMVFTILDKYSCMIFEPLIIHATKYITIHIKIENHTVTNIKEEKNILVALRSLGMELEPIFCGGNNDSTIMEREQWQSGANFFALEPGKVIGYGRNTNTIEALNKHGYDIANARDIVTGKSEIEDYDKLVITIEGNELSRGGGGARCMTMPVARQAVVW